MYELLYNQKKNDDNTDIIPLNTADGASLSLEPAGIDTGLTYSTFKNNIGTGVATKKNVFKACCVNDICSIDIGDKKIMVNPIQPPSPASYLGSGNLWLRSSANPTVGGLYIFNGTNFIRYGLGSGSTDSRPTLTSADEGYVFFDETLDKIIAWKGTKWIESDGAKAGVIRSGTWSERPTTDGDIYKGFAYFCTDKQTAEGQTDGIVIYYKGNGVWADALGRVVS
jgi:hypothetical protein